MPEKRRFSLSALILTLVVMAALLGVIYVLMPEPFMAQMTMLIGAAIVAALVLWSLLLWLGGRAIDAAAARSMPAAVAPPPVETKPAPTPAPVPTPPPAPVIQLPDEMAAVQLLGLLQRKGRLVDFLQEDLSQFDDVQIGAAVRTIHAGCKAALDETMTLAPIVDQAEGSTMSVPAGFDANRIRLSGTVSGQPPFQGVVRHRGWTVTKIDLPQRTKGTGGDMIVAAAEVEVGG